MLQLFQAGLLLVFLFGRQFLETRASDSSNQRARPSPTPDHQWHEAFDMTEHDADILNDRSLHDVADVYDNFFVPGASGWRDLNMTAIMREAEKQRQDAMQNGHSSRPVFIKQPVIPNTVLKRLSPDIIQNMTAAEVLQLADATEMSYESMTHLLSNLRPQEFDKLLSLSRNYTDFETESPDPTTAKAVIDSCHRHWGPVSQWTVSQVARLGPMLTSLNIEQIKQLNDEVLPEVIKAFARLGFQGQATRTLVLKAKRSWGAIGTWTLDKFTTLGPLQTYLTPQDLKQIQPGQLNFTSLLSLLGSLDLDRGQARAVINIAAGLPEWRWTLEQVQSLGKMTRFLDSRELRAAPASAFASPELLKELLPSDGRGHQQQTKEIARVLKESRGTVNDWTAEDFRSMGRAASGLEVNDLEQLDPSVVQGAIADIADAEYSPRQRNVLIEKYREARGSRDTSMSADEVRQMKGLAVGLSTSDLAHMDPQDVRESMDVFASNANKMKKTQKREIIKQLKEAPGGIQDAIQDMGDMVKELPLRDLDSLCTANFTAAADENSTGVAAAGRMNWTEGQSMKLFRCFKDEVLGSSEGEGGSSADLLTPATIRYMGSMAKGMSCDDVEGFVADDILPTVGAMMEQEGWSPRLLDCTHQKIKASLSAAHDDYTADFTEIEIAALRGQLLKELSVEELNSIPSSHCEMLYSEIGNEDLIGLKRDKRKALTSNALQCLGVDGQANTIEQDTMDIIGNLACDLEADMLRRLSSDVFTGNLYSMQKCCLNIDQMVVIGERLVQEMGSPNQWMSDTISDIGPLLVSLSELEIQNLEEEQFSLVAEDVMVRFAEYKDKWSRYCDVDLRPQDISSREEGFVTMAIKAKDALVAVAQADVSGRKRRDSTYSPTCNEIESLSDGNIAWTVDELGAMTVNTFDSCGYALGEVTGFSDAQLAALLDKAKEAWGQAADMTPDQISQLGHIASKFTAAEIGQLNLTETDTVYAIAQYNIYTSDQLSAGVGRFSELSGLSVTSLDSLDLTALANFLCGLTAVEMEDIASIAYQEAANAIGELRSCDAGQWATLKTKAVDGYGAINTWMPEVFAEVGSVVAGFTTQELSSLSDASIAGIKPHAVSLIPPQTLAAGWSSAQLSKLDQLQAEAVTEEQLAALSQEQRSALLEAEYGDDISLAEIEETTEVVVVEDDGDKDGNGAGNQSAGLVPTIIIMCNLMYRAISIT
ncbi:stereocilin-like [Patiria miniata]|uniref:Stereocilin LRR domain-containing protein n=1 Tax=Patiria miniata TaxID=46514 RepID=A0A914AK07_PATMI|nr:stereocilin-like [Patiria miniata]